MGLQTKSMADHLPLYWLQELIKSVFGQHSGQLNPLPKAFNNSPLCRTGQMLSALNKKCGRLSQFDAATHEYTHVILSIKLDKIIFIETSSQEMLLPGLVKRIGK